MEERDFFKDRLSADEIRRIASMASVDEMFAWGSPTAKPYRDQRGELSDDALVDLMLSEPRLIRRPILIKGGKVLFGYRAAAYDEALGAG